MKRSWIPAVVAVLLIGGAVTYILTVRRGTPRVGGSTRVKLYFANREYVRTGDESLPRVLPEERKIDVQTQPVAEAAIRNLMMEPRSQNLSTALARLRLNGVRVRDGVAYVDFAGAGLSGGSLEERLIIEQVVRTLTELEGVGAVQLLVDGETRETLMGHMYTEKPITRADLK